MKWFFDLKIASKLTRFSILMAFIAGIAGYEEKAVASELSASLKKYYGGYPEYLKLFKDSRRVNAIAYRDQRDSAANARAEKLQKTDGSHCNGEIG